MKGKRREKRSEKEKESVKESKKIKEREGHTRAHTYTNTHTSKLAHDQAHTSTLRCPLTLHEVKGNTLIFIGLGCLEIFHLFLPPARPTRPQMVLGTFFMLTPTLFYRIPTLFFRFLFLFCHLRRCPRSRIRTCRPKTAFRLIFIAQIYFRTSKFTSRRD